MIDDDDEMMICAYYALKRSKSYAEFCASRQAPPPPLAVALRYVKVHWDEAPEWVRDTASRIDGRTRSRQCIGHE